MNKPLDRNEFFQELGRKGMLAGLVGVGIAALHGSKSVSECFNHNLCASCHVYGGCELPEKKEIES
jgi:hypothetical protein